MKPRILNLKRENELEEYLENIKQEGYEEVSLPDDEDIEEIEKEEEE